MTGVSTTVRLEEQSLMRRKPTKIPAPRAVTDWKRLRALSERDIREAIKADPEARATDAGFWKKAEVVLPKPKQAITIRLDVDLLEWFRKEKGYQTRINAVLRSYMRAHAGKGAAGSSNSR